MSDNKMGGVPTHIREALYQFFDKVKGSDDKQWANVIRMMTKLGPNESLKRLQD